jgi:predicted transcriptional regulator
LLRVLTPRRWELLKTLRCGGAMRIRALSKTVGRDYKNVHSDVTALEAVGLIDRADSGLIRVPWDEIDAHMQLAA